MYEIYLRATCIYHRRVGLRAKFNSFCSLTCIYVHGFCGWPDCIYISRRPCGRVAVKLNRSIDLSSSVGCMCMIRYLSRSTWNFRMRSHWSIDRSSIDRSLTLLASGDGIAYVLYLSCVSIRKDRHSMYIYLFFSRTLARSPALDSDLSRTHSAI
jgi:hypothetical protein